MSTTSLAPNETHAGDPFSTGEDVGYLALRDGVGSRRSTASKCCAWSVPTRTGS